MEKILSRFGEIEYDSDNCLLFPNGLVGFEALRNFVVMPNEKEGPLFWIQSVEDPQVAFILTDPTNFFPDYQLIPDVGEREKLGMKDDEVSFVLSVVTVSREQEVTLNLSAPIFYSAKTNRALQIILDSPKFSTRTPLPQVD